MATVAAAANLKRKRGSIQCTVYALCLLCQSTTEQQLRSASDQGKERIRTVIAERRRLNDTEFVDVIDRLETIPDNEWTCVNMKWHKDCYSNFTAET